MLLRESGEQQNLNSALDSITAEAKNLGVENETVLLKLAEAVYKSNPEQMTRCRDEAIAIIGARATVDAIGVAAAFNGITKIANATGLCGALTSNMTRRERAFWRAVGCGLPTRSSDKIQTANQSCMAQEFLLAT